MVENTMRIGVMVGREWSFPPAFIEEVNRRSDQTGVFADYVQIGGTAMNEPVPYQVIIDRISHEVPYYRSYLKNAALQGTRIVNDPFMWTADDKFFGASLLTKMGLPSPRTVVLPNKEYVPGIKHDESLRNLTFPLDWQGMVDSVGGFPVILKDAHGGGWRDVYVAHSMDELWQQYNQSSLLTMIIQEFVHWENDDYARCMCIGQEAVRVIRYNPNRRQYFPEHGFDDAMAQMLHDYTLTICRAFGYDMNTVEFAIRDGIPYAIDFMNPAPDMDVNSLGQIHFDWIVQTMADQMIELAMNGRPTRESYQWGSLASEGSQPNRTTPRRRGRPAGSKNKTSTVSVNDDGTPRRRGRPAGSKNKTSAASVSDDGTPKRRGRPPGSKNKTSAASASDDGTPKRRGRPAGSKNKTSAASVSDDGTPKRRGRPPGSRNKTAASATSVNDDGTPKRRGRPAGSKNKNGAANVIKDGTPKRRGRPAGTRKAPENTEAGIRETGDRPILSDDEQ